MREIRSDLVYRVLLIAALVIVGWGAVRTTARAEHERLEITGFLDRDSVNTAERVSLQVNMVNLGEIPLTLSGMELIPASGGSCPSFGKTTLRPHATWSAVCQLSLSQPGTYNVGAKVSWAATGKEDIHYDSAKIISRLTVTSSRNSAPPIGPAVWALLAVVLAAGLAVTRRRFADYQIFWGALVGLCFALIVAGVFQKSPALVIAGLAGCLVGAALLTTGRHGFQRLVNRLVKAGPVEFSPYAAGSRRLKIAKIRESEYIEQETTPAQIVGSEERIDYYIELSRLRGYWLESELIASCEEIPSSETFAARSEWLKKLKSTSPAALTEDLCTRLEATYLEGARLESFKRCFNDDIKPRLQPEAQRGPSREDILRAIETLEAKKDSLLTPQYFVNLARLNLMLHKREKALSLLYEGYDLFPDNLKTIILLSDHLAILNQDFTTAAHYGMRAVRLAEDARKNLERWYGDAKARIERDSSKPPARYLKPVLESHEKRWRERLSTMWLEKLELQLKNNVAYYIGAGRLDEYAGMAREFAKTINERDTLNYNYLDTLGFVMLRFADGEGAAGDEEEVKRDLREACSLFSRAANLARRNNDEGSAEAIEFHYEQAAKRLESLL
ncbi:MAG TPA: hypothetical protein VNL14_17780 [Candidatus Acidoferrales bacterium]|nr:hypothetical protein [Candidatus Acidoferrales bacterium]